MQVREPTWGQQFKNAVMLGPQLDSDNLIVDNVSLGEGLFHFATIGWKFVFALVPPSKLYSGAPAFFVALTMIGIITAIVE
jgi:solute carrier family 8 (sodium/calcium exchanger)